MKFKTNHNRAITLGDKAMIGIFEKPTKKQQKYQRLRNKKIKKKIGQSYAKYGNLKKIREARMQNKLKDGWTRVINTEPNNNMNTDNLIKLDIQLIEPTPAPSPSESIDPEHEEGIVLTEEDRYNYQLDMSELIAEEKRSEEYHGVRFCE